jgi:hypothetical protein
MIFPPIVENTHIPIVPMSGAKRKRLFEGLVREFGLICYWCDVPVVRQESGESRQAHNCATLDHKIPRIFGGTDKRANSVISCWKCNSHRGRVDGFLSSLAKFRTCAPNRLFGVMIRNGEAV